LILGTSLARLLRIEPKPSAPKTHNRLINTLRRSDPALAFSSKPRVRIDEPIRGQVTPC
jgi:hypothetical protein